MHTKNIQLCINPDQADAVCEALQTHTRIAIGQLEYIAELVRDGVIPMAPRTGRPRATASPEVCDAIRDLMRQAKELLGYPPSGSLGISHPQVALPTRRAYEAEKVLAQTLAEHREPNPSFRSVAYDGLGVRYTQDPPPVATRVDQPSSEAAN